MYRLEFMDDYNGYNESHEFNTLEEALNAIAAEVKEGRAEEYLRLYKEIKFSIEVNVTAS